MYKNVSEKYINACGSSIALVTTRIKQGSVFNRHYSHVSKSVIEPVANAITVIGYESHDVVYFGEHDKMPTIERRYNLIYEDNTEGGLGRTTDYTELVNCPSWVVGMNFSSFSDFLRFYGKMESNKDYVRYADKIAAYYTEKLSERDCIDVQLTSLQTWAFNDNFVKGRYIKNIIMATMNSGDAVISECGNIVRRLDKLGRLDKIPQFMELLATKINIKLFNENI